MTLFDLLYFENGFQKKTNFDVCLNPAPAQRKQWDNRTHI